MANPPSDLVDVDLFARQDIYAIFPFGDNMVPGPNGGNGEAGETVPKANQNALEIIAYAQANGYKMIVDCGTGKDNFYLKCGPVAGRPPFTPQDAADLVRQWDDMAMDPIRSPRPIYRLHGVRQPRSRTAGKVCIVLK
jgi:hypothetical protein